MDHSCATEVGLTTVKPGADPTKAVKYQRFSASAFSAAALAPVLKNTIHTKPGVASVMATLGDYLVTVPETAFVHSVVRQALDKTKELSEEERVTHLDSYCKLLRAQNHHAETTVTDFEGMKKASLNFAVWSFIH